MKISINSAAIKYVSKSNQKTEEKNNTITRQSSSNKIDVSNTISANQQVNKLQTMQQEYVYNRQMFGALTQLTEALELFQQQPSVYQQNVQEIIQKVQKDFPQLSEYVQNLDDVDKLNNQLGVVKKQLDAEMTLQKKAIATKLITEQNREAVRTQSEKYQSATTTSQQTQSAATYKIAQVRIEQITKLLS